VIYWKFKYSRTQRALAVGVSEFANKNRLAGVNKETALKQTLAYYKELKKNS